VSALAVAMGPAFELFRRVANRTGLRRYEPMSWRAAALSLMDIFAARYAHAHTYDEVCEWYREAGFETPRLCALERRGFSVCGTRKDIRDESRMKSMS